MASVGPLITQIHSHALDAICVHPLHTVHAISHNIQMKPNKLSRMEALPGGHTPQNVHGLRVHADPTQFGVEGAQGVSAPGAGNALVDVVVLHGGGDVLRAKLAVDKLIRSCTLWAAAEAKRIASELRQSLVE
jgi:hypothetical protein